MVKTSNQVSSSAPFTKSHLVPHVFTSRMASWRSRGNGTSMNQLWFTSFPCFFIQHNRIYLLHNTLIYYIHVFVYIFIRVWERERDDIFISLTASAFVTLMRHGIFDNLGSCIFMFIPLLAVEIYPKGIGEACDLCLMVQSI